MTSKTKMTLVRTSPATGSTHSLADTVRHTLKVLLHGHSDYMFFNILADESDRLFAAVQSEGEGTSSVNFIVFDTSEVRVAINLSHLMFCQFLWDVTIGTKFETAAEISVDPGECVQVYFSENPRPLNMGVDADESTDIGDEHSYLNTIFYELETGFLKPEARLYVIDEDGESALLRVGDVTMLTAPLWVVEPDVRVQ